MDFVADQLADGRKFRSLTVEDIYPRECLAIDTERRLKGENVVLALNHIQIQRGVPKFFYCDNGVSFSAGPWVDGPIRSGCAWRVRNLESQPTLPWWNRSTERSGQNASIHIGSRP